jgi:hypothetical protein
LKTSAVERTKPNFWSVANRACQNSQNYRKLQTAKKRNTEKNNENYYNRPKFEIKKKLYLKIQAQRNLYFIAFFKYNGQMSVLEVVLQTAVVAIGSPPCILVCCVALHQSSI